MEAKQSNQETALEVKNDQTLTETKKQEVTISSMEMDEVIEIGDKIERAIQSYKKIKRQVLGLTVEDDWTDQGGSPYLDGDGAKAIADVRGISYRFIERPVKIPKGNGHYRYKTTMEFMTKSRTTEEMGSRTSDDPFFSARYKSPDLIDEGDVEKASITNCISRGVSGILGLRSVTWDDLKNAGLNISKIRKISFKKSSEQTQSEVTRQSETEKETETEKQIGTSDSPPARTEKPKNAVMITPNQLNALKKMIKEPLENVTVQMFNIAVSDFNLLTKQEASKIIENKLNHS